MFFKNPEEFDGFVLKCKHQITLGELMTFGRNSHNSTYTYVN